MKSTIAVILTLALATVHATPTSRTCKNQTSGLVDLGYARHTPTFVNETASGHKVSIYKNIRFANPPTGDLRFRRPDTELPIVDEVQDGHVPWGSHDCISTAPMYVPFPDINGTTWGVEDCLFLDVYVPEGVKPGDDVPVLHWFYGSAYAFGSKEIMFNPMGLFDQMFQQNAGKFIFVANNYRMGVSGFSYSEDQDMDSNVGLFDCLAAAEWTSKFIHKFGGNHNRITAAGQSAGAGMLYYMSTLHGGEGELPFQQMFLSSPAVPSRRDVSSRQAELLNMVLEAANCSTLECLRSVPLQIMLDVNTKLIAELVSTGGGGVLGPGIGFGPAPDGDAVPDMPLALFNEGRYHKELKGLMLGSMALEGMGTSHDTDLPAYFPIMVRQIMPTASNETVSAIQSLYHPEIPAQLAWDWTTDAIFACNAYNLANAMPYNSRRYIMSTPPATHGQDSWFYFYVDETETPLGETGVALAREFQTKLLQFVRGDEELDWPAFGEQKNLFNITDRFEATTMLPDLQHRCHTINKLVLDSANGA